MNRVAADSLEPVLQPAAVQLLVRSSHAPGWAVVRDNRVCTAGRRAASVVRHIELELLDAELVGAFRAGQCVGVIPPGVDEQGKAQQMRLFSLANPTAGEDGQGRVISITVKRLLVEDRQTHRLRVGLVSNYLCDLEAGQRVMIAGPVGRRLVPPANAKEFNFILLATGTGIAPFRGIVRDLLSAGHTRAIHLYAGAAYASDLLYHREFQELAQRHDNFRYLPTVSRHEQPDGSAGMYVHQRMLQQHEQVLPLLSSPRTIVQVCGVAGMELGVCQALATMLPHDVLGQYLELKSPQALQAVSQWTTQTLHAMVKARPRLRIEVY